MSVSATRSLKTMMLSDVMKCGIMRCVVFTTIAICAVQFLLLSFDVIYSGGPLRSGPGKNTLNKELSR